MDLYTIFTWWPSLIMGWPAIGAAALCALAGIGLNKRRFMIAAGIIAIPFSLLYALLFAPIVLGGYFGAAQALKKGHRWWAAVLVLPVFAIYAFLAHTVLTQPDPSRSPHTIQWQSEGTDSQKPSR
jgi:hypothetical protein